jgi:SNF2 family DNA or RNA helicase
MYDLFKILWPHQHEDSTNLANRPLLINGSEMGTGKTETAIAAILKTNSKKNLIVCPSHMVLEWRDRIREYIDTEPQIPFGFSSSHQGYKLDPSHFRGDFLIINQEMLRIAPARKKRRPFNYVNVLKLPRWEHIIIDECHRFKNPDAQQSIGLEQLVKTVRQQNPNVHIHPMSGSVFTNYPNELWSVLNILHPKEFPNYQQFTNKYCVTIPSPWGPRIVGARKKYLPELRAILATLMIRREKRDVMPWLPEKYYRRIPLQLHSSQRKIYNELEEELIAYLDSGESIHAKNGLVLTMKLRQWCLDSRLLTNETIPSVITSTVIEFVRDYISANKPLVIFSWFDSYLKIISSHLTSLHIQHELISGSVSQTERRNARHRFQSGQTQIVLGSISTMEGIDLTAADTCIFTDRYWVPLKNVQAEDRLHRGTQQNKVQVIDLIPQDTIYQDIYDTIARKTEAFNETVAIERTMNTLLKRRKP